MRWDSGVGQKGQDGDWRAETFLFDVGYLCEVVKRKQHKSLLLGQEMTEVIQY